MDAAFVDRTFARTEPRAAVLIGYQALLMCAVTSLLVVLTFGRYLGLHPTIGPALAGGFLTLISAIGYLNGRRRKRIHTAVLRAWEKLQLGEDAAADSALAPALDGPIISDSDRGMAFNILGELAARRKDFETSGSIYLSMLQRGIGDLLHQQLALIGLAASKLRTEELTDAVTLLGRMEHAPMPPAIRASCDLVRLYQQVSMGHFEDAISDFDERRGRFRRYLSTQAGFAYGLLGAAMHYLGRAGEAAKLWQDATTLVPSTRLLDDYALLRPLADSYPGEGGLA